MPNSQYEKNMALVRSHMSDIKELFKAVDVRGSFTLMITNPLRPNDEMVWTELDLDSLERALQRAKERRARQEGAKSPIILNGN